MITLRFVAHSGIFNWACRIAQYGFWGTHCEAVMPNGKYIGAISDGVKERYSDYDDGQFSQEVFLEVKTTAEQEEIFYAFVESQIGKGSTFTFTIPVRQTAAAPAD